MNNPPEVEKPWAGRYPQSQEVQKYGQSWNLKQYKYFRNLILRWIGFTILRIYKFSLPSISAICETKPPPRGNSILSVRRFLFYGHKVILITKMSWSNQTFRFNIRSAPNNHTLYQRLQKLLVPSINRP